MVCMYYFLYYNLLPKKRACLSADSKRKKLKAAKLCKQLFAFRIQFQFATTIGCVLFQNVRQSIK